MKIAPHLAFDGNCCEAFEFYARTLGGTIRAMIGEPRRIMHAEVELDGCLLMGADSSAGSPYAPVRGACVVADFLEFRSAERAFAALGQGASIEMPLQETFRALRHGILIDRFGVPWMINCSKPT